MQYLVIMGILIVVALILIVIIITAVMKSRQNDDENDEEYDDEYDDDEIEENPNFRRNGQNGQRGGESQEEGGIHVIGQGRRSQDGSVHGDGHGMPQEDQGGNRPPEKKLWKLVLENLNSWQKSTFVFYENIGIGRGHSVPQFEKFLSIGDDPRVSKLHCAIIKKDDKLYLKDMGSRNGTYLNEKRITQPVLLQRDDVIRMGETEIEVQSMMRER